ncbi:hypothetical protein D9619_004652 [Psilocybe cf. subviscida]|uniref:F-box domain-containing protein n=1 Tax=Psilocybe cf. subviscida TaxID=2480587 RepID=A0A8H5F8Z0_9AGAR|nr:hypothetical protein D9619_004652 [Psilocybe cf. subviscida]
MAASRQVRKPSNYNAPLLSPSTSVPHSGCGLPSLGFFQLFRSRRRKNGRRSAGSQKPNSSSSSFSTPVRKVILLPTEIIARIFLCFTSDPTQPSQTPNIKSFDESVKQPLILSHVCKHWRYVALGTPILWSSIYITRDLHPNLLHLFLRRTLGFPLAVYIDGTHHPSQYDATTVSQPHSLYLFQRALPTGEQSRIVRCMMLLRKSFHRCVKMDATLDTMSAFAFLDMLNPAPGPQSKARRKRGALNLAEVAVCMTDRTASSALLLYRVLDCLHTIALSTPSFQTLHWESARPLSVQKDLILHPIWSQLKTIHIRTKMSSRDCALLLRTISPFPTAKVVHAARPANHGTAEPQDFISRTSARGVKQLRPRLAAFHASVVAFPPDTCIPSDGPVMQSTRGDALSLIHRRDYL